MYRYKKKAKVVDIAVTAVAEMPRWISCSMLLAVSDCARRSLFFNGNYTNQIKRIKIMKMKSFKWTLMFGIVAGLVSCGINEPKMTQSSFETMTVEKSNIELPYKFSARMKGQNDVTVTPQVSGQLMKICVTEGQQVKKGQTLFVIDQRNAQLELEAAQANLQAALAQENSAKLEYESNKNLFDKKIVSSYMLNNSENSYKQAQASVAQAKAAVNRAKVNLGFCTITASVSGIIGEIPVRAGDQVSPMTQLTMLSGNTTMYAEFSVTEAIVEAMVKEGMNANEVEKYIANLPPACRECRYRLVDR